MLKILNDPDLTRRRDYMNKPSVLQKILFTRSIFLLAVFKLTTRLARLERTQHVIQQFSFSFIEAPQRHATFFIRAGSVLRRFLHLKCTVKSFSRRPKYYNVLYSQKVKQRTPTPETVASSSSRIPWPNNSGSHFAARVRQLVTRIHFIGITSYRIAYVYDCQESRYHATCIIELYVS